MFHSIDISKADYQNFNPISFPLSIGYINNGEVDYQYFFEHYLLQNIPCIIKNVTSNWICRKYWVDGDNQINYKYILEKYGNVNVPVADCSEKFYNAQKKTDMLLSQYLKYLSDYNSKVPNSMPPLYLKDWHFRKEFPNDSIYNVPFYFGSDWLNEFLIDKNEDDYMFVYMGPKGTWTPFHADVFSSFSWSVNITGRKRWLLFPPNSEKKIVDALGNLPYDVTQAQRFDIKGKEYIEVYQNPGEALFVPSKWHHQVWNVEDTLSINHNWLNGCNIYIVWESMKHSLSDIKREIHDCRNMDSFDEHCQLMLKTMFGMDFQKFFAILSHISLKRINKILYSEEIIMFESISLEKEHCKFDLKCILTVLKDLLTNADALMIDWTKHNISPEQLINKLENVLL